jgi:thiol:disulfide interchange protein/DsbC/DsbD-like thiol-disulfide interchange protein
MRDGFASATPALMSAVVAAALLSVPSFQSVMPDAPSHSSARLITDVESIQPGQPFTVGLQITLDPGWHTYWINAGDAGHGVLPTWDLPAGFAVDTFQYPRPERIPFPPLMSYGYKDEVVLLTTMIPPSDLATGSRVRIVLEADYLVCEDVCIPARDRVSLDLPVRAGAGSPSGDADLIARARLELPVHRDDWALRAARTEEGFLLGARPPEGWSGSLAGAYFFPLDMTTLTHTQFQEAGDRDGELRLRLPVSEYLYQEPVVLEGILTLPPGPGFDGAGSRTLLVAVPVERVAMAWTEEAVTPLADPLAAEGGVAVAGGPAGAAGLSLLLALVFAFIGGLILNLMPCVFPILSLKALGFAAKGGDRHGMRMDGLAFGAGVILTFLLVAAVLLAVRAGGAEVGWGYQLQSPAVVALLAALMVGIGLWLAGVVELGASLTRVGGIGTQGGGQPPAFLTGVLATVVATPCTAPFMGAAMGAALIRPVPEALAIFGGLGMGMATPYVLLAFWPALAQRLPRPGRWMETFKQVLAFPMFAVAIWLVWVFGLQVGMGGAAQLLFGLLLLSMAAWLVGRWPAHTVSWRMRLATRGLAVAALGAAFFAGVGAARPGAGFDDGGSGAPPLRWETYSQEAIDLHRQAGRPVFVDFTAAWCISCRVNERVALQTSAVRRAFAERDVALLKADWTRRDPEITRALAAFGRVGVPLYVLYPADPASQPRVLPELLTQRIMLDALSDLPLAMGRTPPDGAPAGPITDASADD